MAVLAHALQMIGGWIAVLIILFLKRESKFVMFHALQVLLLQVAVLFAWILFIVIWISTIMAAVFHSIAAQGGHQPEPPIAIFILMPFLWLGAMAMWVAVLVLAIMYAIKAGHGEWADYPLFGPLARRLLHLESGALPAGGPAPPA